MINFMTNPFKAVDYQESAILKALEAAGSLIADVKYDGVRGNIVVNPTTGGFGENHTADTRWVSRVSKDIPALAYLNGSHAERWAAFLNDHEQIFPNGLMIDGELMVKGVDFNTGSGLLRTKWAKKDNVKYLSDGHFIEAIDMFGAVRKKHLFRLDTAKLKVIVYAVLPLEVARSGEEYQLPNIVMREHAKHIVKLLNKHFPEIEWCEPESYDVYDLVELQALYEKKREEGHEGLIVKDPFGNYKRGKKTGWWKMKPDEEIDGTIVGINWGTPGLANEGKVIGFQVMLEDGFVVNANGITQAQMEEFTAAVTDHESGVAGMEFAYQGYACQVRYMERFPDGSLRHPSFDKFRGTEEDPKEKM